MTERREFVLEATLPRALWSLSWPIVVANELQMATVAALVFWIGRYVGETGLAVESLFRPVAFMFSWSFASITIGTSVLVSRSVGAGDRRGLAIVAGSSSLIVAAWAVIAAIVAPLSSPLAGLLASGDLTQPMLAYSLAWVVFALPSTVLVEHLLEAANATGHTKLNIVRVLVDLVVVIALTPVLMKLGLGIAGAPIALAVAAVGLTVFMWIALVRGREQLNLGELGPRAWSLRSGLWKEVLAIGAPVQAGRLIMFAVEIAYVQMVARESKAAVAGYGVAMMLSMFGGLATMGLAQGGGVMIGQALGAKLEARARRGVATTLSAGWLVMAAFVLITILLDRPLIGLFTSDVAIIDSAHDALAILRWGLFGASAWQCLLACFAAYRTTVHAALLMIIGEAIGLVLALAWPGSNLQAVCVAFVAANVVKSALLIWLFLRRR